MNRLSKGKIIFRYTLLLLVCAVIFFFSANNGEDSTSQSGRVVDFICRVFFPDIGSLSFERAQAIRDILSVCVRKAAHLFIYTLLGGVAFAAFFPVRNKVLRYFLSVGFAFVYACTDEFHQTFIADRTGKFSDVIIDVSGSMAGALIVTVIVTVIEAGKIIKENKRTAV